MGIFSRFESRMEDTVEGAADKMVGSPLSPVQIAKKAEKQMRREKMVGAGKQYAPTLYTVLVNEDDDERLFGYYPTLAGETETYLSAKASEQGLVMDGQPLVRFIVDEGLKRGKFEIIAEMVAAPLVSQLRQEEMERYGLTAPRGGHGLRQPHMSAGGGMRAAGAAAGMNYPEQSAYDYDYNQDNYNHGYDDQAYDSYQDHQDTDLSGFGYGEDSSDYAGTAHPNTVMFDSNEGSISNAGYANPQDLTAYLYDITNDRAFTLSKPRMSIGRETINDIVIPDINVSRSHAEIRQNPDGTWVITDLGSTNGTTVNGRRVKSAPLHDADMLLLGTTNIEFQLI